MTMTMTELEAAISKVTRAREDMFSELWGSKDFSARLFRHGTKTPEQVWTEILAQRRALNPFELCESPGARFHEGTLALYRGLEFASPLDTWRAAAEHMSAIQQRYEDIGANDTEPREIIIGILEAMKFKDAPPAADAFHAYCLAGRRDFPTLIPARARKRPATARVQ
jgi:hypothetical protein